MWISEQTSITCGHLLHQYKTLNIYKCEGILTNKGWNSFFSIRTNLIVDQYFKKKTQRSAIGAAIWVLMIFNNKYLPQLFILKI